MQVKIEVFTWVQNASMPDLDTNNNLVDDAIVTPKTIDIFSAFAVSLKRIHIRLIAEGYIIKDGRITKSERLLAYEQDNKPLRKNK